MKHAINPAVRSCHFVAIPIGCGIHNGIKKDGGTTTTGVELNFPCQRGPQNITTLQNMFFVVPFLFIMLFPVVTMSIAYIQVRFFYSKPNTTTTAIATTSNSTTVTTGNGKNKNDNGTHRHTRDNVVVSHSVAKQSAVYLLALYGIYAFDIIDSALVNHTQQYFFLMNLLATTTKSSIGVWTMLVYLYFRSEDPIVHVQQRRRGSSHHDGGFGGGGSSLAFTTTRLDGSSYEATATQAARMATPPSNHSTSHGEQQSTNARNSKDQEDDDGGDGSDDCGGSSNKYIVGAGCIRRIQRPEFSIFDSCTMSTKMTSTNRIVENTMIQPTT